MTYPAEKFCLKWNDFQQNITSSYNELRKDSEFSDVTLVCERGQHIEAHRIILTACSPFFSTMLKGNKHSHPMIYMRGFKTTDLVTIVDFIYHGEANIYQEDLDGFLALAEELQLKGLSGTQEKMPNNVEKELEKLYPQKTETRQPLLQEGKHGANPTFSETFNQTKSYSDNHAIVKVKSDTLVVNDLRAQLDSMMEKVDDGENKWKCKVCGKATRGRYAVAKSDMRRHIETHMEGLSYPCNHCGQFSRSSQALKMHIVRHH